MIFSVRQRDARLNVLNLSKVRRCQTVDPKKIEDKQISDIEFNVLFQAR